MHNKTVNPWIFFLILLISNSVVFAQFEPVITVPTSLNGSTGFEIRGDAADDVAVGNSVTSSVDINSDGVDDAIICTRNENPTTHGACYVVYGSTSDFPASINLTSIFGNNGFVIKSPNVNERIGNTINPAGDFNDDGIDDVILSSSGVDSSYIIYGRTQNFPNVFNLSTIDETQGVVIQGNGTDIFNGASRPLGHAGDINNDGIDDVIIGYGATDTVSDAYVIYGSTNPPASINLTTLDGNNGFTVKPVVVSSGAQYAVSSAGDINNDGIDDLIIGHNNATANGMSEAGVTYVIFGNSTGFESTFELSSLNGANGFTVNGVLENDFSGISVSTAGDLNSDGIDDLLIGAYGTNQVSAFPDGTVYVIYGSAEPFSSSLNLSDLNGVNGFSIPGTLQGGYLGVSVNPAGDLNKDGIDDISISAPRAVSLAGSVFVILGNRQGFAHPFDLSGLDGDTGFRVPGASGRHFLGQTGPTGDVNGDGIDDIVIGADGVSFSQGAVYVVYGIQKDLIFDSGFE